MGAFIRFVGWVMVLASMVVPVTRLVLAPLSCLILVWCTIIDEAGTLLLIEAMISALIDGGRVWATSCVAWLIVRVRRTQWPP